MENQFNNLDDLRNEMAKKQKRGQLYGGIALVVLGSIFLLKQMDVHLPYWIFNWKVFLIGIGIYLSVKSSFQSVGAWACIVIGSLFLWDDYMPNLDLYQYIWPIALIGIGLFLILKPKNKFANRMHYQKKNSANEPITVNYETVDEDETKFNNNFSQSFGSADTDNFADDEYINSTSVFGGVKKIVLSKNLKGGEINSFFAGTQINLINADFKEPIILNINQMCSGMKIIVPSNWEIKSEMTNIIGGIDDRRTFMVDTNSLNKKIVYLKGYSVMGGIEIVSFG